MPYACVFASLRLRVAVHIAWTRGILVCGLMIHARSAIMTDGAEFLELVEVAEIGQPSKCCRGPLHKEGVYLTIKSFWRNRARYDGLKSRCRACEKFDISRTRERRREIEAKSKEKFNTAVQRNVKQGYGDRLKEFKSGGGYEEPVDESAAERLRAFVAGERYEEK